MYSDTADAVCLLVYYGWRRAHFQKHEKRKRKGGTVVDKLNELEVFFVNEPVEVYLNMYEG